jgi:hypothetical protein
VLEKTSAETQRKQIAIQLQLLIADLNIAGRNFNILINTSQAFLPASIKLPEYC